MPTLESLLGPHYFYFVTTKRGMPVDMGYVYLSHSQTLIDGAHNSECILTLVVPNNTCH